MTREEPAVSYVSSVSALLLVEEPIAGEYVGPLHQQPSLMAVDEQVRQRTAGEHQDRMSVAGGLFWIFWHLSTISIPNTTDTT